jgi:DNA-binding transcriptional LysR family regulator
MAAQVGKPHGVTLVAAATELHFGHTARKLQIGQPRLSDLVRRLEREVGTQLLARAAVACGARLTRRADRVRARCGSPS